MIRIKLNGELREVEATVLLPDLLDRIGLAGQPLVVELNGRALLKSEWPEALVEEGARVEFVRVVAGG